MSQPDPHIFRKPAQYRIKPNGAPLPDQVHCQPLFSSATPSAPCRNSSPGGVSECNRHVFTFCPVCIANEWEKDIIVFLWGHMGHLDPIFQKVLRENGTENSFRKWPSMCPVCPHNLSIIRSHPFAMFRSPKPGLPKFPNSRTSAVGFRYLREIPSEKISTPAMINVTKFLVV